MVSSVSNLAFKTTAGQLKTSNYMMTTSFPCPLIPILWVFVFFEKKYLHLLKGGTRLIIHTKESPQRSFKKTANSQPTTKAAQKINIF